MVRRTILEELKSVREEMSAGAHRQLESFTKGISDIASDLKRVLEETSRVSSFQEIFKSPKLTGIWGEEALEHILSEYDSRQWIRQHEFLNKEKVDAVFRLPNGKFLPIDSKFPLDVYEQMREADENHKTSLRKTFINRVKQEIDNIATKYILPAENTTDFAVMYIPAESVYDAIGSYSDQDIFQYARDKKVIITSPNKFHMTISILRFWLRDIQFSQKTQEIIKRFDRVIKDAEKLQTDFKKLGRHLSDAKSSYENVDQRFNLLTERAHRAIELGEEETQKLISPTEINEE